MGPALDGVGPRCFKFLMTPEQIRQIESLQAQFANGTINRESFGEQVSTIVIGNNGDEVKESVVPEWAEKQPTPSHRWNGDAWVLPDFSTIETDATEETVTDD